MFTLLDYFALVNDDDIVCIHDGRQAMGYDNNRTRVITITIIIINIISISSIRV